MFLPKIGVEEMAILSRFVGFEMAKNVNGGVIQL